MLLVALLAACGPHGVVLGDDTSAVDTDTNGDTSVIDTSVIDTSVIDTGTPPDPSLPVAVCGVDPTEFTVPSDRPVRFLGGDSYDPQGHPITTWMWALGLPAGSHAQVRGDVSNPDRDLFADLIGDYTGTLVVTTDDGRISPPCTVTSTATTWFGLDVTLTWAQQGDDLDLHLLAPNGELTTQTDCFYDNCLGRGPNWGDQGSRDDDPIMLFDDQQGTGPEESGIHAPAAGIYTVVVHDYPTNHTSGEDLATITITYGGTSHTLTRSLVNEGDIAFIATISIPDGTVTECASSGC